jgi:hypothetical protein
MSEMASALTFAESGFDLRLASQLGDLIEGERRYDCNAL